MNAQASALGTHSHVAVVGAGHAGVQFAVSLRELGFDGTLRLFDEDGGEPYDRPSLSKEYLSNSASPPILLRSADFYAQAGIEIVPASISAIDRGKRMVCARNGEVWEYTHLVLATGGRPNVLDIPGRDLDGVMTLRTLEDATRLRRRLATARSVAVVGGGFIGLEIASAAAAQGREVTVVETADRLLARSVSEEVSEAVLAHHRANGAHVVLGQKVTALVGSAAVSGVSLESGSTVPADLVVIGVGMAPADQLAERAGLLVDRGVVVDDCHSTSDPQVSAIGDCAVVVSRTAGTRQRLESIPNAQAQARHLAHRLMGLPPLPPAVPWFWSHQGDLKLQITGLSGPADQYVPVRGEHGLSVVCFAGERLVAVESCNDAGTHMAARRILESATPVTVEMCRSSDFDLRTVARSLRARDVAAPDATA